MFEATRISLIGITIQARLITGTYTDLWRVKDYLSVSLFDIDTLDQKIRSHAINAKDKVNTFLGRTVDFTKEELETTRFGGIVDAASQLTACYVQKNPQAAAMEYTEDTIEDCKSALETLTNWALTNGITPPSEMKKRGHILTELSYFYNNPDEVI
jgi:hypothetical protein